MNTLHQALRDELIEALTELVYTCGRDAADTARLIATGRDFGDPWPTREQVEAGLRTTLRCPDDSWVQ